MNQISYKDFHTDKVINCIMCKDVFTGLTYATLLGGEFSNCYGQGKNVNEALMSLKIRVNQLRNKNVQKTE